MAALMNVRLKLSSNTESSMDPSVRDVHNAESSEQQLFQDLEISDHRALTDFNLSYIDQG